MAEKNCFDMTKLFLQIMCVTVVQWSRSYLQLQINRVRLPVTLFLFLCTVFFPRSCLVSFSTLFFLLAFFSLFSLLTLLVMHLDQNWYFNLKCGVLFWKRISKALDLHTGRAYWRAENTHNVKYNTSFAEPPIAVSKLLSLAVHWPSKVWPVGMIVH